MSNKVIIIDGFNFSLIGAAAAINSLKKPSELQINYNNPDELLEDRLYDVLSSMIRSNKRRFSDVEDWYCCWDSYGGKDFRSNIDTQYKANRDHKIIDFKVIEPCKPLFEEYNIKNITVPKAEADDIMNTLGMILKKKNPQINITIISRDHDMIQTIQKGYADVLYDPVKKKNIEIPWYSIVDFKALVGDKSDNIPGVKGIGKKKALNIITEKISLNDDQKIEFEKYKDMIDFERNPRKEENYKNVLQLINV